MFKIAERVERPAPDNMLPVPGKTFSPRSPLKRWLAGFFFLFIAFAISMALRDYITRSVFVFFFAAIAVTAWYSGLVVVLVTTVLSLLATNYFLIEPIGRIEMTADTVVMSVTLMGVAAFISWLTSSLEDAKQTSWMHAEELEEQARELEEAAERAEAASRAKTDFLAVMSHELRTPLNAIVGYADLLQTGVSGPLTETQHTHLSRIRASSFHLLDLIQDVLSFSRIEAGREDLRIGDVEVQQIVRDAHSYIEQQCAGKGLQQEINMPEERLVMITDPAKLRQILLNLLNNACKFTDTGTVNLNVFRNRDDVIFQVKDTGPGIAAEYHEMVFEPFTQVNQSKTREKGGAGLGLPVSRRLAHLLGGDLQLESTPGKGSTFTLRLPIQARLS